ncbi:hypothetical protein K458DRAFT_384014 [Lentithecium fluviatile CBS 122367]|uniref:Cell death in tomato 1 n=1 Tax=Lentithecium fluviatile CBS 122367 TaxID=1168545 RepID=A0A6G1JGU3_9PLEO|nr:hypothetical protein K458DRAFT_384014 [Lentithecium fluviatile CBS 122367]
MHFLVSVTTLAALVSTSLAAPVQPRQDTLTPWQLDALSTFSPSGRPGNYPWLTITASLTDPNTLTLGTSPENNSTVTLPSGAQALNCQAKWLAGETPFGRSWPCDNSGEADGYWTIQIPKTDEFSVNNFDLVVRRVAETLYLGSSYKKVYEARTHFEVGVNLSGTCGGSGVCSWGLRSELVPLDMQQSEVED